MNAAISAHVARSAALAENLRRGGRPRLAKPTSNLFRDREADRGRGLEVGAFTEVLAVDNTNGYVDAEGMASYEALADVALAHGVMPAVVPQLKTITLGGAVAGVGIEASSYRHGLVHETVSELEVLTGDGSVILCTPDNEHRDLFFGFPNSYGTLGYALRVKAAAVPVKAYVRLVHRPFQRAADFFEALELACREGRADFIDAVVFASDRMFLTQAAFVDEAPRPSDYTYEHIYYRSIEQKREDWLTTRDFLWRWDTDWFWCSKNLLAQNPVVRRIYGRRGLGSKTYARLMRWNSRVGLTRALDRLRGRHPESVIQDVDIPIASAARFLEFFLREIAILPIWICPIGPGTNAERFSLYPMRRELYVNFGFWDVVHSRTAHPAGHFNRRIEREVARLGGIKSLYSESHYPRDEFEAIYGGSAYRSLKARYDPAGTFPTLYEKCVQNR